MRFLGLHVGSAPSSMIVPVSAIPARRSFDYVEAEDLVVAGRHSTAKAVVIHTAVDDDSVPSGSRGIVGANDDEVAPRHRIDDHGTELHPVATKMRLSRVGASAGP